MDRSPMTSFPAFRTILFAALLFLLAAPAAALVHLPTGEFRETVEDLRVKIRHGHVVIARTWQADDLNKGLFRWHANPVWDDLTFTMDVIDGVPKTIHRAGARFERSGNGVYIFDRQYFIRPVKGDNDVLTGWRWSDRLGHWITYAADGRIAAYGDRNGTAVTFVRDPQQRIAELRDGANALALSYAWSGEQLTSIVDRAGRTVTYHYTGALLTSVTDVLGQTWSYGYTGGLLTTLTDPLDRTTTVTYNGHRAVRVIDPDGHATHYSYDYDRVTRAYTVVLRTPQNRRTERRYDADGRLRFEQVGDRVTSQMLKDGDFVELLTDERGGLTRTERDANRHPVKVVYPDGASTTSKHDGTFGKLLEHIDERGIQSTYTYDSAGRMTQQTEAAGTPQQRITTFTYDAHGQRLSETIKGVTPADDATTSYSYDAVGNIASLTDAEGRTTSFTHDVTGAVLTRTDARGHVWTNTLNAAGWTTAAADPLGHSTTIAFDAVGNRTSITDALNHTTTFVYDGNDRLVKTTDPLGGEVSTTYSPDGQRLTQTDAVGSTTTFAYDTDGRLTSITDPVGNVTALEYGTQNSGLAGLLVATDYPTYREEYKIDPRGRRTQTIQVLPATQDTMEVRLTTTTGYDAAGNRSATIDPAGRATLYRYDALSRLIETVDPEAGLTAYGYDVRDNLRTVTDANGHTHTFTYDRIGQVQTEARPMGAIIAYAYDPTGNLTQRVSPNGERRQYDYDHAGRKTDERHYPKDSDTPSQTIAYAYDARNALTSYTQTGDTHSAAAYVYDANGQKTEEIVTYGQGDDAFSHTMNTAYRPNGQKQSFTYPDATTVNYTYTANGLLQSTTLPGGGDIAWTAYEWQQPKQVVMPGAVRTVDYDALQRPTRIKSQAIGARHRTTPRRATSSWTTATPSTPPATSPSGKPKTAPTPTPTTRSTASSAPPRPQPCNKTPSDPEPDKLPVEAYTYDPVHNRLSSQHQPGPWTYNADNQLLQYGIGPDQHTFTYNPNGHTASEITGHPQTPTNTRAFLYNAAERLTEVKDNGQTIGTYQYDPFGRRIRKSTPQKVTWFAYEASQLIAESNENGSEVVIYGQNLWQNRAEIFWMRAGGETHLSHNEITFSTTRMTSVLGDFSWKEMHSSFGDARNIFCGHRFFDEIFRAV
jgi:YD repeat-containing protein